GRMGRPWRPMPRSPRASGRTPRRQPRRSRAPSGWSLPFASVVRVLLVDDDADRATAVVARDLGAAGWVVGSASANPSLAALSRFVARWHRLTAIDDEDAFVARLAEGCAG